MMFRVDLEGLASYRNRWEWVAEGIPSPCNTRVQGKVHRCNCNKPQSAQVSCGAKEIEEGHWREWRWSEMMRRRRSRSASAS